MSVRHYTKRSIAKRLERLSVQRGECRIFVGALSQQGYGQFSLNAKTVYAHRAAWFAKHGEMPMAYLLHSCDTPACISLDHLREGTQKDNMADCAAKGRNYKGGSHWSKHRPLRGERHGNAKISDDDVSDIRVLRSFGLTQAAIATIYEIHQSSLSTRLSGKNLKVSLCQA